MPKYVTQEHFDQKIETLVTKEHFNASFAALDKKFVTKDEFHTRMDEVVIILKRLDQERVFTVEWIRRIEGDVSRIKHHLKLA